MSTRSLAAQFAHLKVVHPRWRLYRRDANGEGRAYFVATERTTGARITADNLVDFADQLRAADYWRAVELPSPTTRRRRRRREPTITLVTHHAVHQERNCTTGRKQRCFANSSQSFWVLAH